MNGVINVPIICLIGAPGSGKGTQAKMIAQKYNMTHIGTGDLLRAEMAKNGPGAGEIKKLLEVGQHVPKNLVEQLINDVIVRTAMSGTKGYIIDGYPRDVPQGSSFEKRFKAVKQIIYLEVSPPALEKRLKGRTGAQKRIDDNDIAIKKRIMHFKESVLPLVDQYKKKKQCVVINGEMPIDAVFAEIDKCLAGKFE
ncbi:Adenylate kinase isoenzyme 1 [Strongyloides ratti]|uniref:Adenylate kinase isoenzyme 1 n=1 Tax=Strongyloides ratti TaxID=34506 RepID=A0A090L3I9_STRRB|nr:Adenylate kinase isoenzyme 1 [Strongyloides ratti]CEF62667.1 Adenylate kinase isoenzyme 1 [Strongyloides ratti]